MRVRWTVKAIVAMAIAAALLKWAGKDIERIGEDIEYNKWITATCGNCRHEMKIQRTQIDDEWECWCGGKIRYEEPKLLQYAKRFNEIAYKVAHEVRSSNYRTRKERVQAMADGVRDELRKI